MRHLVAQALRSALTHRMIAPGLVFHSDRGSQYASDTVRTILGAHKMVQSMSGTGNCYDNAITETFFHTLKTELIHWERFETEMKRDGKSLNTSKRSTIANAYTQAWDI